MSWADDRYIRNLLDSRERWGIGLSIAGVAACVSFLARVPNRSLFIDLVPLVLGLLGLVYVLLVNIYLKQARALSEARGRVQKWKMRNTPRLEFSSSIGVLGWIHIFLPLVVGLLGSLVLRFMGTLGDVMK